MNDHDEDWVEQQLAKQNLNIQIEQKIEQLTETLRSQLEGDAYTPPDERGIDLHRISWDELLSSTPDLEARWLIPDLIAKGRNHAIIAGAGAGKSELLLWAISRAARGIGIYDEPIEPVRTLYLDWEMGQDDLRERMQAFGYTPGADLDNLIYLQPPEIGELDQRPRGDEWPGSQLVTYAQDVAADLVVIDTFSRSVAGEENSNDTTRDFYRYTGQLLKTAEIAQVRLDHIGHGDPKRARGGSAKNADIDVSMILTSDKRENLTTIERGKARMSWWPELVRFSRISEQERVAYQTHTGTPQLQPPDQQRYTKPDDLARYLRKLFPTSKPSYQVAYDVLVSVGASWTSRELLRSAIILWNDPDAIGG